MGRPKAPPYTKAEIKLLTETYTTGGLAAAVEAIPARSAHALAIKAQRLKLRSPNRGPARSLELKGADLARAVELREAGWSYRRIGAEFGVCETAASNALNIALCARRGHRLALRDRSGRLVPEEIARVRYMLKKGLKHIEIQQRMGISAATVSGYRRSYNAELIANGKAPLPPAGNGERYCGAKLPKELKRDVERLLLTGMGTPKVGDALGVSRTQVQRMRVKLVARLQRKGECIPGCDLAGRRLKVFGHAREIPPASIEQFKSMLLERVPVRRAARLCGIGDCSAYRIRDEFAAALSAAGEELPPPVLPGRLTTARQRALASEGIPTGERLRFRRLVTSLGEDAARIEFNRLLREEARPKSFEEQLARVAAGATLSPAFRPSRAAPEFTLGGVATGML